MYILYHIIFLNEMFIHIPTAIRAICQYRLCQPFVCYGPACILVSLFDFLDFLQRSNKIRN